MYTYHRKLYAYSEKRLTHSGLDFVEKFFVEKFFVEKFFNIIFLLYGTQIMKIQSNQQNHLK